jgi:ferredoxin--NADP+ reductase
VNNEIAVNKSGYCVAIFGGGVAGTEAAFRLSQLGIRVVLFEQHALPYGKIEEGLPKWHIKLREQEEAKIDEKLNQSGIYFVPNTKLGGDLSLSEIQSWGFNAILLAVGAWRDRPFPVADIEKYLGKGFCYQNEFVSSFNHRHELNYPGSLCEIPDDTIVIGGGLASFDVMKILMLETVRNALLSRGIRYDLFTLERDGIDLILKNHKLTLHQLGLKGSALYYRRRIVDMPLSPMSVKADSAWEEKVFQLRRRIAQNFIRKYLFRIEECCVPIDFLVQDNRLAGLVFQRTRIENNHIVPISDSRFEVQSSLVISSIGSIPEPAQEIPMEGGLLSIEEPESGKVRGFDNVFAVGNAITGRGNIRESLLHSREITGRLVENYFDLTEENFNEYIQVQEKTIDSAILRVSQALKKQKPLSVDHISRILEKTSFRQHKVGYGGNYKEWIAKHLPVRLEDLMSEHNENK